MTRKEMDIFEMLFGRVLSVYEEMSLLSKKNPNDAVNKFKLSIINKLLVNCNTFLGAQYKPLDDFSEFDIDDLPQTSDVIFIISQYLQCFEKYRSDHVVLFLGSWYWEISNGKGEIEKISTIGPKNLKEK